MANGSSLGVRACGAQMQVTFNGLERTLPELRALLASAGWRIVRVSRTEGSLFGRLVTAVTCLDLGLNSGSRTPHARAGVHS